MRKLKFRANPEKALEVILWLANRRPPLDFHAILKLLFFADVYHLNIYGRPIVGDQYRALPYGPVPQTTYDILKGEPLALEELGDEELPFEVVGKFRVNPLREANERKLSASDIEALAHAWETYGHLGFGRRTGASHEHPAYCKAAEAGELYIDYADFLEASDEREGKLEDLHEIAHRLVI